ncbi:CGNR zinc finger domain-containing protein [Antrihabitans cavernicola]|nr:CGNR zinc finger domain-containing protein [Spelaeibacter cavernicola]
MSARSTVPMVSREGTRFSVATGAVCLQLIYTGGAGLRSKWETLHNPADFADWVIAAGLVEAKKGLVVTDAEFESVWILREALWESANSCIDGVPLARSAVGTLNRLAAQPDVAPRLSRNGSVSVHGPVAGSQVLSTIARDAIALFGGPLADRLKRCAADDCAILFVDTSRPGGRRWCAMSRCGNRDKVRNRRRLEKADAGR